MQYVIKSHYKGIYRTPHSHPRTPQPSPTILQRTEFAQGPMLAATETQLASPVAFQHDSQNDMQPEKAKLNRIHHTAGIY